MSGQVQYWPLMLGWTLVALLGLFGWRRQAAIAAAGMLVVSLAVISTGAGWT